VVAMAMLNRGLVVDTGTGTPGNKRLHNDSILSCY
jgi:hypothetical protein